jgi:hypothetical protein
MKARFFLNVDLDLESGDDLRVLAEALQPEAYSLERPAGRASFELNASVSPETPEPLILEFVRLVNQLPPSARAIWDRASKRVFDIGIQSRRRSFSEAHRLSSETLRAAAEIGAEIGITVYGLADDQVNSAG